MTSAVVFISQTRPRDFHNLNDYLDTSKGTEYTLCSNVTYQFILPNNSKKKKNKEREKENWKLVVKQDDKRSSFRMKQLKNGNTLSVRITGISGYANMSIMCGDEVVFDWCRAVKVCARNEDGEIPLSWKIDKKKRKRNEASQTTRTEQKGSPLANKRGLVVSPLVIVATRGVPAGQQMSCDERRMELNEAADEAEIWTDHCQSILESDLVFSLPSPVALEGDSFKRKREETVNNNEDEIQQKRQKTCNH